MTGGRGEKAVVAGLRARAHPLRLRMLSLLTGAPMSAAELARELRVSQALASYHLRQLADVGLVELAEERSRRGGRERRYRYRVQPPADMPSYDGPDEEDAARELFTEALMSELRRRTRSRAPRPPGLNVDAELWVLPADWERARDMVAEASTLLHERARRPREPGSVHVNTSVVMFAMDDDDQLRSPSDP